MAEGETINCDAVKSIVFIYEAAFGLHFLVTNKPRSLGFAMVICIDCKWWHIKSVGSYILFVLFYCFLKADEYFSHPTDSLPWGESLDELRLSSQSSFNIYEAVIYTFTAMPTLQQTQVAWKNAFLFKRMHFLFKAFSEFLAVPLCLEYSPGPGPEVLRQCHHKRRIFTNPHNAVQTHAHEMQAGDHMLCSGRQKLNINSFKGPRKEGNISHCKFTQKVKKKIKEVNLPELCASCVKETFLFLKQINESAAGRTAIL